MNYELWWRDWKYFYPAKIFRYTREENINIMMTNGRVRRNSLNTTWAAFSLHIFTYWIHHAHSPALFVGDGLLVHMVGHVKWLFMNCSKSAKQRAHIGLVWSVTFPLGRCKKYMMYPYDQMKIRLNLNVILMSTFE